MIGVWHDIFKNEQPHTLKALADPDFWREFEVRRNRERIDEMVARLSEKEIVRLSEEAAKC